MNLSLRSPRLCGLVALLAAPVCAFAGAPAAQAASTPIIATVAGFGTQGYTGDGGPATSAKLNDPYGVAVDSRGDLFIADTFNSRVREVNATTGIITTVAGNGTTGYAGDGGPATSAELYDPRGVAFDARGDLLIADTYNSVVRKVDATTGVISTIAGKGADAGYAGDGGPATSALLYGPSGLAVDARGDLFIADAYNHTVREVSATTGDIATVAGNGTGGYSGDGGTATSAQLHSPSGVAVDAGGDVFIADTGNQRIREVEAGTGDITTVAGIGTAGYSGDGGPATGAQLTSPSGVAVDAGGDLFIADTGNQRIREVNAGTGDITTVAGIGTAGYSGDGGPATSARLNRPNGVALDAGGDLFIAEIGNSRVREVSVPPALSADLSSVAFGSVTDGQSSGTHTVTVTNTGGGKLNIGQATLGGADVGQFAIGQDTCSNSTVTGPSTCTIQLSFAPTSAGAKNATLTIPSNDPRSPATVSLSGAGQNPSPAPQPTPPTPGPQPPTTTQPAPPTNPQSQPAPVLSVPTLSAGGLSVHAGPGSGPAHLTVQLSTPATVRLTVQRRVHGRWVTVATHTTRATQAGPLTLALGADPSGHPLTPGRYRVVLQAQADGQDSPSVTVPLTVTPPANGPHGSPRLLSAALAPHTISWSKGHPSPTLWLTFLLSRSALLHMTLQAHIHGRWHRVAAATTHVKAGADRVQLVGRWKGHLVPARRLRLTVRATAAAGVSVTRTFHVTVRHGKWDKRA